MTTLIRKQNTKGAPPWAAVARKGVSGPLPYPGQRVGLKQLWFRGLPADAVAAIRQYIRVRARQAGGAVLVHFHQVYPFGWTGSRENHRQAKLMSPMSHHRLAPAFLKLKAAANGAVDTDVENLSPSLFLSERDQNTMLGATAVAVNGSARMTPVIGEYLASPPHPVHVGRDVILQQPDGRPFVENGFLASAIAKLKRVLKVQNLIQPHDTLGLNAFYQFPGFQKHRRPIGVDQAKQHIPQARFAKGVDGHGLLRSVEDPSSLVNRSWLSWRWSSLRRVQTHARHFAAFVAETRRILFLINRQEELQRLVKWAVRKELTGPRKCYEGHIENVERKLLRYRVEAPRAASWAQRAHVLKRLLVSRPRYPRRGAAAEYSRRYAASAYRRVKRGI